jgi:hypothetical protein
MSRVVDGAAGPADWDALEALALTDSTVWRELALAQRADQLLKAAVREAAAPREHVELPPLGAAHAEHRLKFRLRQVATWGGWAAAAAVTLAFLGFGQVGGPGVQPASIVPTITSADQALDKYLDLGKKEGRVIGELPDRVMVNATKLPDGHMQVVFVRQIVEKTEVRGLSQPSTSEAGQRVLTPVEVVFPRAD